jgi:AcrR family transcriptional regulator
MVDQTKVLLILRAAGELLDECGFDELNTTEIARRAGVSTATLYRHFPDKYSILKAVVTHLQGRRSHLAWSHLERLATEPDWRQVVNDVTMAIYKMRISEPGGRSSRRMLNYTTELRELGEEMQRRLAKEVARRMCQRKPGLNKQTAERVSLTALSGLVAILDLAGGEPRNGKRFAQEGAEMACAYLAPYLD